MFSLKCPFHSFMLGAISTGVALYLMEMYALHRKKGRLVVTAKSSLASESLVLETSELYEKELRIATTIAIEAGNNITSALKKPKNIDLKGDIDFVTQTDKSNEKLIFTSLRENFPSHVLIGEETCSDRGEIPALTDMPTWIVDPIDGTTNFVHNFPYSCVSIGLLVDSIPVVGVVYIPSSGELYQSVRGHGAYVNGKKIAVSNVSSIKQAMIMTEFGYQREPQKVDTIFRCLRSVVEQGPHAIRQMGSAAIDLCYVANGSLDAVYAGVAGEGWWPWDYAAGWLIVTEAGGVVTTVDGVPFHTHGKSVLAASSAALASEIQSALKKGF